MCDPAGIGLHLAALHLQQSGHLAGMRGDHDPFFMTLKQGSHAMQLLDRTRIKEKCRAGCGFRQHCHRELGDSVFVLHARADQNCVGACAQLDQLRRRRRIDSAARRFCHSETSASGSAKPRAVAFREQVAMRRRPAPARNASRSGHQGRAGNIPATRNRRGRCRGAFLSPSPGCGSGMRRRAFRCDVLHQRAATLMSGSAVTGAPACSSGVTKL